MNNNIPHLLNRISVLEARLKLLEAENFEIVNSTTWRMTRILRSVLQKFPFLREIIRRVARFVMGRRAPPVRGPVPTGVVVGGAFLTSVRGWTQRLGRGATLRAEQHAPAVELPSDYAYSDQKRAVRIDFKWSQTARPSEVSGQDDSRSIAAAFVELTLSARNPHGALQVLDRIDFRRGGNSLRQAIFGFSFVEDWGTWTSGGSSGVLLWAPIDAPEQLILKVQAGIFGAAFEQVVADVFCDRAAVGAMVFDGKAPVELPVQTKYFDYSSGGAQNNLSHVDGVTPDVSIIVLNYNKPVMTLAAVLAIVQCKTNLTYEIIVLDNGSRPENYESLAEMDLPARVVFLNANRFFGEGNNIAAEYARAKKLLFLNNDAFVSDYVIDDLSDALDVDGVGAAGPVFTYPDGTLQEVGAYINLDGTATQRGKFDAAFDRSKLSPLEVCDYVSAACVMLRTDDFMALGGFDMRYDPAYYEDSDLCLRLQALGKRTVVVTTATVVHVENATTSDPANKGLATDIVERHRQIFLTRWRDWLNERTPNTFPKLELFDAASLSESRAPVAVERPVNAVFTPFPLTPGGGERYILGVANVLSGLGPTAVVTPDGYSGLRVNSLTRDLGFSPYRTFPLNDDGLRGREVDRFVLMGNELLPTRAGMGRSPVYHCQFPFPRETTDAEAVEHLQNLGTFKGVVVNSRFTRDAYLRRLQAQGVNGPPVEVIHPPVRLIGLGDQTGSAERENVVLTIGRFTDAGHSKRQDAILEAFSRLVSKGELKDWRLLMVGVVPNDPVSIRYYERLLDAASNTLGAEIVLAPSRAHLEALLRSSRVYVSATGFGAEPGDEDWKCEHFGITIVEAASAGCVPVTYDLGGPPEILEHLGAGFRFHSLAELEKAILDGAALSVDAGIAQKLSEGCADFSDERFHRVWTDYLSAI